MVSHTPDELAEHFEGYFDRILVDAPCSGEGMFRKNEDACMEWSPENVEMCGLRQDEILDAAAEMLCGGGRLVYSTCTFAPCENEGSISRFLKRHPEFQILPVAKSEEMSAGNPMWAKEDVPGIENTVRIWPHKAKGEGHYAAVLQKAGVNDGMQRSSRYGFEKELSLKECQEYISFQKEYLKANLQGVTIKFGDQLYLLPKQAPALRGLKVLRPGLHLGTMKKNRFEPSHALALTLRAEEVTQSMEIKSDDMQMKAYLSGQTFPAAEKSGWCLITTDGYSIGWGKAAGGIMKNHYPKGLRKSW